MIRYLSVCSGIEAASCAWKGLGWNPVAFSEIEAFPCAVLKHHFPETPNWGDMTKWRDWPRETVDLLVGGTPCQSFSTAGLRKGLDDVRGQLAFGFSQIARYTRPRWVVWENVPGVLSSGGGRDFGSFVQSLVELGYGCTWRVLDAQHFGVPQRRRRVFLVGYLGDWRNSAAVLFESESLRRNPKKGGGKGRADASGSEDGSEAECGQCGVVWEPDGAMEACPVCGGMQAYTPRISQTLQTTANDYSRADGFCMLTRYANQPAWIKCQCCEDYWCSIHKEHIADCECPPIEEWQTDPYGMQLDGPKSFTVADARRTGSIDLKDQAPTLTSQTKRGDTEPCVFAFPERMSGTQRAKTEDVSPALGAKNPTAVMRSMQVRRLTPLECERLQGFPDGWTDIPYKGKAAPDGPRYKAIGNSMAVPVMRWIGNRIQMVEELMRDRK